MIDYAGNNGIKHVTLYGSRAIDNYRASSDIDWCRDTPTLTLTNLPPIEVSIKLTHEKIFYFRY